MLYAIRQEYYQSRLNSIISYSNDFLVILNEVKALIII